MNKLFRVSMSFAIVLVAYWAYALVVVPVVSPSVDPEKRQVVEAGIIEGAEARAERHAKELAALFPAGSWELVNKPKVLESDQAKLLVGDYTPQPDGRVLLKPCTIVFFPKEELQDAPLVERQAIIMEAPKGALLQFDRPFDLSRAQFGNLIGGSVSGPVTIRSKGKPDDPEDDLRITTQNIRLSEKWITTDEAVRFQYGKHSGSGRRMRIELEQDGKKTRVKKKKPTPQITGMKSFLLRKVDYLRLLMPEKEDKSKEQSPNFAKGGTPESETKLIPVEVACTGEFRLDVEECRAAFKDNVVVSRFRTEGPADQLLCDELVIHFTHRKPKNSDGAKVISKKKDKSDNGLDSLEPSWLEARGIDRPATIHSTVEEVDAYARELQYHLKDRRIVLQDKSGKEPVRLNQADNTFTAKYIEYQPDSDVFGGSGEKQGSGDITKKSSLGQLVADGPGVITARLDEESDQHFTATWQKELRLRPHEKNQVISLTGGATIDYGPTGKITANSIHFFLIEKPKKTNKAAVVPTTAKSDKKMAANFQPDRMRADGDVKIESKQISGEVDQFQVWFEVDESSPSGYRTSLVPPLDQRQNPSLPTTTSSPHRVYSSRTVYRPANGNPMATNRAPVSRLPGPSLQSGVTVPMAPRVAAPVDGATRMNQPGAGPPVFAGAVPQANPQPKKESKQHFHITGRVLQANVLLREETLPNGKKKRSNEVTKLTILDNVHLVETETDEPNVEPIIVKGDRIHVLNATMPDTSISMFGRPAEFVGRGIGLAGSNINLNRGTNRLWVNGPGTMRFLSIDPKQFNQPVQPNNQSNRSSDKPQTAIITWQQEMDFDGQTITFLEQVIAETAHQKLYTEQLTATLTEKIDFAKSKDVMSPSTVARSKEKQPELLVLTCHGGANLNSRMYDELGRLESVETAEVSNLKIDNSSGKIYAEGPGWVRSVRRDNGKMLQEMGPRRMANAKPQPRYGRPAGPGVNATMPNTMVTANGAAVTPEKLLYIKIRFQGFIDGDLEKNGDQRSFRNIAFNEQVHGTFGQIYDWRQELPEDDPDALGDTGAMIRCRRLELFKMPSPTGGDPNIEMKATGNVSIEGRQFTARGTRVSYSHQKQLIILEGDGRTEAKLFRQEKIGTAPDEISAKNIMYWPKLDQYHIGGSQSLQFQINPGR